ncbi:MAG: hypothetical protein EOO88_15940 [Pedobacter sp.]|nr:MAG: hypothetical protein EOO88_15940 [Pedobacter sp.]
MMKNLILMLVLLLSAYGQVDAQQHKPFKYKIAIIGNPGNPDVRYDDQQLIALKKLGFNTVQLNIAWGSRPGDEALNLEDILYIPGYGDPATVRKRLDDIKFRAKAAKRRGFRTIFHFGAPKIDSLYKINHIPKSIDRETEENSIRKPEVVQKYLALLKRLHEEVPEIDDILVYTFDQEAWIANEFGNGPTDKDIPLHERLPDFLKSLTTAWASHQKDGFLWWEPWELSAGQIYACVPHLPTRNFGLSLHSNIAEVQASRPVDVWFRNMVNMLSEKNIPVIGEIFMASANEEVEPLQHIAAPRLVFEQLESLYKLEKLAGVKEYYGILPDKYDPSARLAGMKLKNPKLSFEQAIREMAKDFKGNEQVVKQAWEATSQALQLFPWDATWNFRRLPKRGHVFHTFARAGIPGRVAVSPSWMSTRKSLFMLTTNEPQDPWFYEDMELRCKASDDKFSDAITNYMQLAETLDKQSAMGKYVAKVIKDLQHFQQSVIAIKCYSREVNLAFLMRKYAKDNLDIPQDLIKRFTVIMKEDILNQQKGYTENTKSIATAEEMLKSFQNNPSKWVLKYLLP